MSSLEMKKEMYNAEPPISIYTDLPKKMRFKEDIATGIDSRVDGKRIWSLSKTIR